MVEEVNLLFTRSWVQNLSLPGGLLQDACKAVYELANCSVKKFSSLTRFSG